jgi:hypothetical protein
MKFMLGYREWLDGECVFGAWKHNRGGACWETPLVWGFGLDCDGFLGKIYIIRPGFSS